MHSFCFRALSNPLGFNKSSFCSLFSALPPSPLPLFVPFTPYLSRLPSRSSPLSISAQRSLPLPLLSLLRLSVFISSGCQSRGPFPPLSSTPHSAFSSLFHCALWFLSLEALIILKSLNRVTPSDISPGSAATQRPF